MGGSKIIDGGGGGYYQIYFLYLCIVHLLNWQASEASETLSGLSGVYKFQLMRYVYYGHTCAIIAELATHTYCWQS